MKVYGDQIVDKDSVWQWVMRFNIVPSDVGVKWR